MVRYLKMGLALEHRAQTLAPFWAEHFNRTRAAQARWAERAGGEWLTVLGAGRLLDFNRMALLPRFKKLRLVDADRRCQTVWKELPQATDLVCVDISGCLNGWIEGLQRTNRPWPETLALVRAQRATKAYCPPSDAVLSLNILSQLQIVWQEAVASYVQRRFGCKFVDRHEGDWLDALRPGKQALVEQHLLSLERSNATHVMLITDLEYLDYKGVAFRREHWVPPPLEWSYADGWRTAAEIVWQRAPALEGVDLGDAAFARWLPSYRLLWQDCWLWHIAPQGTEDTGYGTLHRVGAFALERSC